VGCLLVPAILCALVGMLFALEFARQAGPRYPICPGGQCRGGRWCSVDSIGDYEWQTVDEVRVLRCKCGHELVPSEGDTRLDLRLPDGTLDAYMVHRGFRGWRRVARWPRRGNR